MPIQPMPDLFKVDSKGKLRQWRIEVEEDRYRAVSGIVGGALVNSEWKVAKPKNVGRSNATTGEQQAVLEAESLYRDKSDAGEYFSSPEEAKSGLANPKFFSPMLATPYKDVKLENLSYPVYVQPKLDGIRCLASVGGRTPSILQSRPGKAIISCPHIQNQVMTFLQDFSESAVLDGELYNHKLNKNFNKLQSLIMRPKPTPQDIAETLEKVEYHVYDVYFPEEPDLGFAERFSILEEWHLRGKEYWPNIVLVDTREANDVAGIDDLEEEQFQAGYEGQIIREDKPYAIGDRPKHLIKRKRFFDAEYRIKEVLEGSGNWAGAAKMAVFETEDGKEFRATFRGEYDDQAKMWAERDLHGGYVGWVCTVRYPNLTPDGKPRFGVIPVVHGKERVT